MWRTGHLSLILFACLAVTARAAETAPSSAGVKPGEAIPDLFGQGQAGGGLPNPRAVDAKTAEASATGAGAGRESSNALPEIIPAPPADPVPENKTAPESSREIKRGEPGAAGATTARTDGRVVDRRAGAGSGWRLMDMLPLLVVLAIIVVIAVVVRRFLPSRVTLGGGGAIEVLARLPLGSRQQLILVRLGRRVLLLGVSAERMTALCTVDDPDQAAALMGEVAGARPGSSSMEFLNSFDEESGRYLDEELGEDVTLAAGGQVRGLLEKVRKLTRGRED